MSKHKVPPAYGGQAVVEGVMFGGKHHYVTAIRRTDGSIDFFKLPRKHNPKLNIVKKIPFLRGIAAHYRSECKRHKASEFFKRTLRARSI